jgi:hypothetical protein
MRFLSIAALPATAILLLTANVALAAGNVLLPPDNSGLNLGLAPQQTDTPAPAADTVKTPDVSTSSSKGGTLPNLSSTSGTDLPYSPPLQQQAPMTTGATNGIATTVIQMPQMQNPSNFPGMPKAAYNLGIDMAEKSVWGANDISNVASHFGIPANQVPKLCVLDLSGYMTSSKSAYTFSTGMSGHDSLGYDGVIQNVTVTPQALCSISHLPPNSGYVMQLGDKYVAPLGMITCGAPTGQPSRVAILYSGNGNGQCIYR